MRILLLTAIGIIFNSHLYAQSTKVLTDLVSTQITPSNIVTDNDGNDYIIYYTSNGSPGVLNQSFSVTKINSSGSLVFTKQYQFATQGSGHYILFNHATIRKNELYVFGYSSNDWLTTSKISGICIDPANGNLVRKFYSNYNSQISLLTVDKILSDVAIFNNFYDSETWDGYFFILELEGNMNGDGSRWRYANVYRLKSDFSEFKLFRRFDISQPVNSRYFVPNSISECYFVNDGYYYFLLSGTLRSPSGDDRVGELWLENGGVGFESYRFFQLSFGNDPVSLFRTYWWDGARILVGYLPGGQCFKKYSMNPSTIVSTAGYEDGLGNTFISYHDQFNPGVLEYAIPGVLGNYTSALQVYTGNIGSYMFSNTSDFYREQAIYDFSFRARHSNRRQPSSGNTIRPSFIFGRQVLINSYYKSLYYMPEKITTASCEQYVALQESSPQNESYVKLSYTPIVTSNVNLDAHDLSFTTGDRTVSLSNVCNEARLFGEKEAFTTKAEMNLTDKINYNLSFGGNGERIKIPEFETIKNTTEKNISNLKKHLADIRYYNILGQELFQFKGKDMKDVRYQGTLIMVKYYSDGTFESKKVYIAF